MARSPALSIASATIRQWNGTIGIYLPASQLPESSSNQKPAGKCSARNRSPRSVPSLVATAISIAQARPSIKGLGENIGVMFYSNSGLTPKSQPKISFRNPASSPQFFLMSNLMSNSRREVRVDEQRQTENIRTIPRTQSRQ